MMNEFEGKLLMKLFNEEKGEWEYGGQLNSVQEVELECEHVADNAVEHPPHYTAGKFETIEMIEEITKGYDDGYVGLCVGSAIKYLSRAPFKHDDGGLEDIRKARQYLDFAVNYLTESDDN